MILLCSTNMCPPPPPTGCVVPALKLACIDVQLDAFAFARLPTDPCAAHTPGLGREKGRGCGVRPPVPQLRLLVDPTHSSKGCIP